MNEFVELTSEFIKKAVPEKEFVRLDPLLASKGFRIDINDTNKEDCVLIIGLNPAGNNRDAELENEDAVYFYCFDKDENGYFIKTGDYVNNKFYPPIKLLVEKTVGSAKWPWCKKSWEEIVTKIKKDPQISMFENQIYEQYRKEICKQSTIYCGDLFYIHKTDSVSLEPIIRNIKNIKEYCKKMIDLHVSELRKHNKNIKYVYINYGRASKWFGKTTESFIKLEDGTPIIFGVMINRKRGKWDDTINKYVDLINKARK